MVLVEEAVAQNVLPSYSLNDSLTVNMRELPPNVAEAYALAIMLALQRRRPQQRCMPPSAHRTLYPSPPPPYPGKNCSAAYSGLQSIT